MRKDTSIRRTTAIELLSETGLTRDEYAPPAHRLLWHFGVDIPPPHFMSFGKLALFQGAGFFVAIAVPTMLLMALAMPELPAAVTPVLSLLGGAAFGLIMARHYAAGRRRHGLPSWHDISSRSWIPPNLGFEAVASRSVAVVRCGRLRAPQSRSVRPWCGTIVYGAALLLVVLAAIDNLRHAPERLYGLPVCVGMNVFEETKAVLDGKCWPAPVIHHGSRVFSPSRRRR
jgi:hypothetical protein